MKTLKGVQCTCVLEEPKAEYNMKDDSGVQDQEYIYKEGRKRQKLVKNQFKPHSMMIQTLSDDFEDNQIISVLL